MPLSPRLILPAALLLCFQAPALARTWSIHPDSSGDAPSIAAAMDSCAYGDSVVVHPGLYLEHDIQVAAGITLRSATGNASSVTIDAGGLGRILLCLAVVDTRIEDLSLRNGQAPPGPLPASLGGGILCVASSPTITGCIISHCTARFGGGVGVTGGAPALVECGILNNRADDSFWAAGGGIYIHESPTVLQDCELYGNLALSASLAGDGGAVFCDAAFAEISGCDLRYNQAGVGGGALYSFDEDRTVVADCTFADNGANAGGAVYLETSRASLENSVFEDNRAANGGAFFIGNVSNVELVDCTFLGNSSVPWSGGAIDSRGSFVTTRGCRFSENSADTFGGAVHVGGIGGNFTLDHAVLQDNSAGVRGGAVQLTEQALASLRNATLHANAAPLGGGAHAAGSSIFVVQWTIVAFSPQGQAMECAEDAALIIACCDLFGNAGGDWVGSIGGHGSVNGNFSADPEFCAPEDGNLELRPSSPCLPGGNPCDELIGALDSGCTAVAVGARVESMSWARVKVRWRSTTE